MKKILLLFALSLMILAVFLGGLEFFLRTTHTFDARLAWARPDDLLGWRFVPEGTFWSREENPRPIIWKTNRDGWKDKEWTVEKKPGTYRVAVLGDSYAEALQVAPEKNFLSLAEKKINALGSSTEWMNFGRSDFGQAEELLLLQHDVIRFQPDLVILFFYPVNDLDDISPKTAAYQTRPFYHLSANDKLELDTSFNQSVPYQLKSIMSLLKRNSAFVSLFTQRLSLLQQTVRQNKIREQRRKERPVQGYLSLCTTSPDPVYQRNYALAKRLIREMAAVTKSKGISFMLVTLDTPAYLPEIDAEYKKRAVFFDAYFFEKDMAAFASQLGVAYLGLQTPFHETHLQTGKVFHWAYWNYQGRPGYWEYAAHTGHWNEEGHELVAELLSSRKFF